MTLDSRLVVVMLRFSVPKWPPGRSFHVMDDGDGYVRDIPGAVLCVAVRHY